MKRYFKSKKKFKISYLFWLILFIITMSSNILFIDDINLDYFINGKSKMIDIKIDHKKLMNKLSFNDYLKEEIIKPVFNEIVNTKPKIYLYNTHQSEEYSDTDVYEVSIMFKEILENKEIEVLVEDTNISNYIKENNLKYKDSYKVTRELLSNRLDEYDLYIDIHRDSSKKNISTINIDGKDYARVMFVVGKNHNNYKDNYELASNLNKLIKNYNNKLTRGIYVKDNSAFNQDLNKNVLLIEIGGVENTSEEVSNTLNILSEVLEYYLYQ